MAEIDIERKSGKPWLWVILGLIGLALIAWLLMSGDDDPVATTPLIMDTGSVATVPLPSPTGPTLSAAAQSYMTTCAEREPGEMGLDHEYTSNCITRLVDAVEETVRAPAFANANVDGELQAAREAANRISESTVEADHSRMTREAFSAIATLMQRLVQDRPGSAATQATQLEQAAQQVDPGQPLLEQRAAVQSYFQQASDALRGLVAGSV